MNIFTAQPRVSNLTRCLLSSLRAASNSFIMFLPTVITRGNIMQRYYRNTKTLMQNDKAQTNYDPSRKISLSCCATTRDISDVHRGTAIGNGTSIVALLWTFLQIIIILGSYNPSNQRQIMFLVANQYSSPFMTQ